FSSSGAGDNAPIALQTFSSSGAGNNAPIVPTDIQLLRSWEQCVNRPYRHSAPPELGTMRQSSLQTFSSSGAENNGSIALQTFSSSGAGNNALLAAAAYLGRRHRVE